MTSERPAAPHGLANFALDFGPLLAFFLAFKIAQGSMGSMMATIVGTGVFMVAVLIAIGTSLYFYRRVSPMMWVSAVLVIGFGGLTIYLRDPSFIQIKPTIIYAGFALLLFGGLAAGHSLLKHVFGPIFPGLTETGWRNISRNWACLFVAMAVLNEVLRQTVSFETWLTVKVWGFTGLAMVFGIANVPMLLRNGMLIEEARKDPPIPPTQ
ncbi:inner membrane-spanning protein YciB [Allosphingosinicella sp.]|jgi:intracellular septation protein|uniref:inner membrane-spanning protein YciB n=1 Tax=Allosphingosinicella sp. TaxID=2823234 RepID=UPI002EF6AAF3